MGESEVVHFALNDLPYRVALNGHPDQRLPNTLGVSLAGGLGADILARLEGLAASTGTACHAGRTSYRRS